MSSHAMEYVIMFLTSGVIEGTVWLSFYFRDEKKGNRGCRAVSGRR